jgi:hypothetical protein
MVHFEPKYTERAGFSCLSLGWQVKTGEECLLTVRLHATHAQRTTNTMHVSIAALKQAQ